MRTHHFGLAAGSCALLVIAGCSASEPSKECAASTASALRTCAKASTVKGVDASYYQGTVSWSAVRASGVEFAIVRTSDGLTHPDAKFAENWPALRSAGLVRGVYQFFRPAEDPVAQANMMLAAIDEAGGLKPGDLPPVLDLETVDGETNATVVDHAKVWLATVEAAIGTKPLVYTAAFMSQTIGTSLADYTLWVANYGASCPLLPSGWTEWRIWQNANDGTMSGVAGGVDTDLFNGTRAELEALTLASEPIPQTPTDDGVTPTGASTNDGSHGATMGSGNTPAATVTPLDPCAP